MIWLYSGTPGSGKSLYSCYRIFFWLKIGRRVIANYDLDFDVCPVRHPSRFTYKSNFEITPDYLMNYAKENHKPGVEGQTLIVIDEAGILFNSRDWSAVDRSRWIEFFSQHRKYGFDIILISQNDRMLDRQIRGFIESEYKFRNISNYGFLGLLLSTIFGKIFAYVEFWYPCRLRVSSTWFRLHHRKAKAYNSFKTFDTGRESSS